MDGLFQDRVHEFWNQLGERLEDKTSLVHPWMWNAQVRCMDHTLIIEEEIEINRPRPPSHRRGQAPQQALDSLEPVEELMRRERGVNFDDCVEESSLRRSADGVVLLEE